MSSDIESTDAAVAFACALERVGDPRNCNEDEQGLHSVSFRLSVRRWVRVRRQYLLVGHGGDGQGVAFELRGFIPQQLGHLCPEILDLPG